MDNSDAAENYQKIRGELEAFSPELAAKREVIAVNKIDLITEEGMLEKLLEKLPDDREVFAISGATRAGVEPLLEELWRMLHAESQDT